MTFNVVDSVSVNGNMERIFKFNRKEVVTLRKEHMEDRNVMNITCYSLIFSLVCRLIFKSKDDVHPGGFDYHRIIY